MYQARENEPDYARLNDPLCLTQNRYGRAIETVAEDDPRRAQTLAINQDGWVSDNPNRYKQHGFYFNADNCIACHACEAACSEKNDNPAHLAFRSVGIVEGGTYPNATRINISLACNHCDNPVCLKGCPTRAYTKFAEYGAVLQDPDICFGCGYCTWVCPYNAPQLDPVKGQVTKCNMCVDRLEVGLKPACAAACLGKALDFGVIENLPAGRTQARVDIPGFPDPSITQPNVRFQQTRTLARDMARVDSVPLKYHRDDANGAYRPMLDPKHGVQREWNLGKLLGSHENAHIVFTLAAQAVAGAFLLLTLGTVMFAPLAELDGGPAWLPSLFLMVALLSVGMFKLNMHLGKPQRFYRGFYNLKYSPVSREIAGVSAFFAGLAGFTLFAIFDEQWAAFGRVLCAALGLGGIAFGGHYMIKLYRIPARPYWNHWHTNAAFIGAALALGPLLLGLVALAMGNLNPDTESFLAAVAASGLALEGIGLLAHRTLHKQENEGAASFYEQSTTYGCAYRLRNVLLGGSLALALTIANMDAAGSEALLLLCILVLVSAVLGRALFYVLVIPTTLPGAFFWRNPGFVEHARETGLADMPQVGVAYPRHHAFKLGEFLETLRTTTWKDKLAQVRRVFTG
ncbi:MAG: dimethyl sulfoxide reductase anchor subunit [Sulfuricella sp.]|nr:dimethyl sulfoxide reductase anchor subunit [Sulfuricella sp.]